MEDLPGENKGWDILSERRTRSATSIVCGRVATPLFVLSKGRRLSGARSYNQGQNVVCVYKIR